MVAIALALSEYVSILEKIMTMKIQIKANEVVTKANIRIVVSGLEFSIAAEPIKVNPIAEPAVSDCRMLVK